MNIIAIVVALGIEQWRTFRWRGALQQAFIRYARWLERRFNGGAAQQGAIAAALALAPAVLVVACGFWALDQINPLLGLAWNVLVLYLLVGFRHFSHAFGAITAALKAGDAITARKRLAAWRGIDASGASAEEIPKLAIERGLEDSYRHVFGTLFWFLVLPGPAGAVLYRATVMLAGAMARRGADARRPSTERVRRAGAAPAALARLGAGAADRRNVCRRRRFRGRDLLLAHAGRRVAGLARGHPPRQRCRGTRRGHRRCSDRPGRRARVSPRARHRRTRGQRHPSRVPPGWSGARCWYGWPSCWC